MYVTLFNVTAIKREEMFKHDKFCTEFFSFLYSTNSQEEEENLGGISAG